MSWYRRAVAGRAAAGGAVSTPMWSVPAVMIVSPRRLVVLAVAWLVVLTSLSDVAVLTDGFVVERASSSRSSQDNDSVKPASTGLEQLTSDVRRPRKKTSPGRPASCTCTCETMMVPATPRAQPQQQQQQQQETPVAQNDYHSDRTGDAQATDADDEDVDNKFIAGQSLIDDTHDIDRYTGNWGHGIRYPWSRLPDHMCFRDVCETDADCCRRFNLCDRSAHVCVDCWYGSSCASDAQCCLKYPTCRLSTNIADDRGIQGQCVDD